MQFTFADANDVTSVLAQITDEEGNNYSFKAEINETEDEEHLNLKDIDSPVMIIPGNGDVELSDELGTSLTLKQGQVGFVMASTNQVVLCSNKGVSLQLVLD